MSAMGDASHTLQSIDALASRPSTLTGLDLRARILATFAFIVFVVSFDRYTVLALLPFALFPVALCSLGGIPLRWVARHVLVASPFAIMLGILNPLLDQAPHVNLLGVIVSGGWVSFTSILLRFALTVSAALVLVASAGLPAICWGLQQLGVPRVFTLQLLFLHRYAVVLTGEASRMRMAHDLRAGGGGLRLPHYASLTGHLLLRSLDRAQRIHQAMMARGFNGQLHGTNTTHWSNADSIFLVSCVSAFALARVINLPIELGQWLTTLAR
jgi:cobalt/nickel transport system permease protein